MRSNSVDSLPRPEHEDTLISKTSAYLLQEHITQQHQSASK